MDQQKLRTLVFEKTGIKIDATDPVFALVALNESVLEETLQRHLALIRESTQGHWPGAAPASAPQTGIRQPAFKAADDNFEAEEDIAYPPDANATDQADVTVPDLNDRTGHEGAHVERLRYASGQDLPAGPGTPPGRVAEVTLAWDARLLRLALAISLGTAVLVLGGQAWLMPANRVTGLSPEQAARLKQAEKLGKAIDKLDARAKAQLQVELDKL